jgi:hypothetical protein
MDSVAIVPDASRAIRSWLDFQSQYILLAARPGLRHGPGRLDKFRGRQDKNWCSQDVDLGDRTSPAIFARRADLDSAFRTGPYYGPLSLLFTRFFFRFLGLVSLQTSQDAPCETPNPESEAPRAARTPWRTGGKRTAQVSRENQDNDLPV